jgi:hypothetical protein
VRKHAGTLSIDCPAHGGTTVTLRFPIRSSDRAAEDTLTVEQGLTSKA